MRKGSLLDAEKKRLLKIVSSVSGTNTTLLMDREYFSVNIEARVLFMNMVRNHIELGFIFAL